MLAMMMMMMMTATAMTTTETAETLLAAAKTTTVLLIMAKRILYLESNTIAHILSHILSGHFGILLYFTFNHGCANSWRVINHKKFVILAVLLLTVICGSSGYKQQILASDCRLWMCPSIGHLEISRHFPVGLELIFTAA